MNLPNKLTLGRIIAVPFFILAYMTEHFLLALIIFILASLTDMLDGQIARKQNLITNFGKIMDPLADKVLVYSAFCLMVADKTIHAWMLIVILAREFIVAGVRTVAASEGIVIAADMAGKIKTVLQMIAVPMLLLYRHTDSLNGPGIMYELPGLLWTYGRIVLWASVAMTVYSGAMYIIKNKEVFKG